MLKQKTFKVTIILAGLVFIPLLGLTQASAVERSGQGESLFHQKCSGCHGLGTGDRPTGPDLAGVAERRERQWIIRFISDPDGVIASGDETANELLKKFHNLQMPAIPLTSDEVEALVAYLSHPAAADAAIPAQIDKTSTVDATRGKKLFTGEVQMANGGSPCLACHGLAGVGLAGSASYGPDLTGLYENFGAEGVAEVLGSLAFPSMEAIYAKRPLTEAERADLGAFFAQVDGTPPENNRLLLEEVAGGLLGLAAVFLLLGWGRLKSVRRALVQGASNRKGGMR